MKEFVIGAFALAAVGPVFAQTTAPPPPQPPMASPMRHQMPERIHTRNEVVAKVREHFARLDTNRDGFLTRQEADAGRAMIRERIVKRLDGGGTPGAPGAMHVQRDPNAAFDRIDANRDGTISRQEFAAGHQVRIERRIEKRADGARPGQRKMRMHGMGGGMARLGGQMFDMADANRDGRVSMQEATDAAVRHFDMADANRDGQVTREERRQMRQAHRARTAG